MLALFTALHLAFRDFTVAAPLKRNSLGGSNARLESVESAALVIRKAPEPPIEPFGAWDKSPYIVVHSDDALQTINSRKENHHENSMLPQGTRWLDEMKSRHRDLRLTRLSPFG